MSASSGFVPLIGIEYSHITDNLLILLTPNINISRTYDIEGLAVVEFTPVITRKFHLYSRIQGLYDYNTHNGSHERSYFYARLGLGYKHYQFGLASNTDYYDADKELIQNYGIFVRANFN